MILDALQTAAYVLCLVTPTYLERQFCIAELGAAQMRNIGKEKLLHGLIVDPVTADRATRGVLLGTQVTSSSELNEIKETLLPFAAMKRTAHEWDRQYAEYWKIHDRLVRMYEMRERLEHIRVIDLVVGAGRPDDVFKNKLYIVCEDSGANDLMLSNCLWEAGPHGVPLQKRDHGASTVGQPVGQCP